MLLMERGPVPLLASVTFWGALAVPTFCPAKVKLEGVRLTAGRDPVPFRLADCGLPAALSVTFSAPVREPLVDGVKVTLTLQLAFTARDVGQLLVCPKSPVTLIPVMEREAVPQLLTVTVCGLLVVFTFCAPKAKLAGEKQTAGAGWPRGEPPQ